MPKLILVKHSAPLIDRQRPSHEWVLSDDGKARCGPLADALKEFAPVAIVCSTEPKAKETARLVGESLGVGVEDGNDLYEHDRSNVPHMGGSEFQSAVALFFNEPASLVLGEETADEALKRFQSAVDEAVAKHPGDGNLVIVSHGTVITLLVAAHNPVRPYQLWRQLRLPSFVVLDLPDFKLIKTVDQIGM